MARRSGTLWAARVFGLCLGLFLAVFALDAFTSRTLGNALIGFVMGLVPSLMVFATVALGWRRPQAAAIVFLILAGGYAFAARRNPDWVILITGPLVIASILFFLSYRTSRSAL